MIGSLFYLTTNRLDIMFSVFICARVQNSPKESYLTVVQRIFRYLVGTKDIGLWYPKDREFNLIGYSNVDDVG